jgi:hypothetical protein
MRIKRVYALLALLLMGISLARENAYQVTPTMVKYETALLEFRDPRGLRWPNFFSGKPSSNEGHISLDADKPEAAFSVLFERMAQVKGDQSRKVLAALPLPIQPSLTITKIAEITPIEKTGKNKATHQCQLTGQLELAGKKVPLKAATEYWIHDGKADQKEPVLMLRGSCSLPAASFGLKDLEEVLVKFQVVGFPVK